MPENIGNKINLFTVFKKELFADSCLCVFKDSQFVNCWIFVYYYHLHPHLMAILTTPGVEGCHSNGVGSMERRSERGGVFLVAEIVARHLGGVLFVYLT